MKKVHRVVVLPDYQGLGLGRRFIEFIAKMYVGQGNRFAITTSSKSAIASLMRCPRFRAVRCSVTPHIGRTSGIRKMQNSVRNNAKTVTLEYV